MALFSRLSQRRRLNVVVVGDLTAAHSKAGPGSLGVTGKLSMMKRKYNKLLSAWCHEEIAALQAIGANEDFLTEPAFADLVLRNVLSKHQSEIRADGGLAEAVFMAFFEKASPSDFRHLAAKDREKGDHELAYLFEMCADHRERGEI
jgi:hypothetical protein